MKTEEEISELLSVKSKQQNQRYSIVKEKCLKEYGIQDPLFGEITSFFYQEDDTLKRNIQNLLAIASNNMVAGLYSQYKVLYLDKRLDEEKRLKYAAFLFILKYGLMEDFQSFLNGYKGDVKDGIYNEIKNLFNPA